MDGNIDLSNRCPGQSYQDIAHKDGGPVAEVLTRQANPLQSDKDIPFERYTSRAFFDLEMQKMWRRVWQYACREEHVPNVGDYYVYDIGVKSIIIIRTAPGEIKGYHNSCLHRGTKLKPSFSEGSSQVLQCPYHGWTWNLDGTLKHVPCAWDFPHVGEKDSLREVRVETFKSFVFINMSQEGPSLEEYLEVLPEHFTNWDFDNWYIQTHVQKELPGNWKLSQEAFMEAYHTPVAHPEMTHVVGDINMQHDIFGDHISRDLCAMASPSPTSTLNLTEQELLDRMLMSDRSMAGDKTLVEDGKSARWAMAKNLRATMNKEYDLDYSHFSDAEMIDSIKYNIYPNLFLYPGVGLKLIQQFRPLGNDPDRSIFDQMVLAPVPKDGMRPEPAMPYRLAENDSYTTVPGIDPFLASVLDQDTDIMRWQREGMYASEKGGETLAKYQESRIRRNHETLDKYLET